MPKTKPDTHKKIIATALRLAATHDWNQLTLEQIAKAAKVPAGQVQKFFTNTNEILIAIVAHVDDETAAVVGKPRAQGTARDRLFEVMMARFDILQTYRPTIRRIITSVKQDPSLARILLPAHVKAMKKMLTLAGLKQDRLKELLATAGLMVIYAATMHCWERDDTKDMSRTMAALDGHLRRADKFAEMIFRAF